MVANLFSRERVCGISVPYLSLTTVKHELHTTQSTVTWVLTAYLLSAS